MKDQIIEAAQAAFLHRLKEGSVSDHTRDAQKIAKLWMTACWKIDPARIKYEVGIHPELNQRIDVVDEEERTAYEFKVSGKNATAEFYKDIVKVILWNEQRPDKIKRLIFITEKEFGSPALEAPMPQGFMQYLARNGLDVEVAYVTRGTLR